MHEPKRNLAYVKYTFNMEIPIRYEFYKIYIVVKKLAFAARFYKYGAF